MLKKKKIEKPVPVPCVCGRAGIMVKTRVGKMMTCPAPTKCDAKLRTLWHRNEESAILAWNRLVAEHLAIADIERGLHGSKS